jgi:hypothetical protein
MLTICVPLRNRQIEQGHYNMRGTVFGSMLTVQIAKAVASDAGSDIMCGGFPTRKQQRGSADHVNS